MFHIPSHKQTEQQLANEQMRHNNAQLIQAINASRPKVVPPTEQQRIKAIFTLRKST